ncbi:hypothetical protein QJ854_gp887 [Moumouvirus goulette]|uniref:Uncharacterized protein n=1 Tax=Moumouvirus goulette TaxID=1247379 RepID=M1NLL8_9VIRU|nr:hypothetical protein QJ854_gp887 [Moumouvirus goulette]AGF84895.1 hypothetical protein glt_00086 [Moumouvirus goulette]
MIFSALISFIFATIFYQIARHCGTDMRIGAIVQPRGVIITTIGAIAGFFIGTMVDIILLINYLYD